MVTQDKTSFPQINVGEKMCFSIAIESERPFYCMKYMDELPSLSSQFSVMMNGRECGNKK
jgi:hypothetical protein